MHGKIDPVLPTLGQIGDFLLHLFQVKRLSVSAIKGYRSALASSLKFSTCKAKEIGSDPRLSAMVAFFERERPVPRCVTPKWNLTCVLWSLTKPPYEPMAAASLMNWTVKTAFLLAFATAKRSSEIHALSCATDYMLLTKGSVTFHYMPGFFPKTEVHFQVPEPIVIPALPVPPSDSIVNRSLCPVRAVKNYMSITREFRNNRSRFFIPVKGSQDVARATVARWIAIAVSRAYARLSSIDLKSYGISAHEVRALSTSWAFHNRSPLSSLMEAAAWKSHDTFSRFYLRSMTAQSGDLLKLGPVVAAGRIIQ
ncbi:MAG: hypothetical protein ABW185_08035 [Sedimenticola sp.]